MTDRIPKKIPLKSLGASVQLFPKSADWFTVPPGTHVHIEWRPDRVVVSCGSGPQGLAVELRLDDVRKVGNETQLRRGARPFSKIERASFKGAASDCHYDRDECDGDDESGCTYCTGALLFCCGGGLTGFCVGVWGCPG
jgi:hypothetical protein